MRYIWMIGASISIFSRYFRKKLRIFLSFSQLSTQGLFINDCHFILFQFYLRKNNNIVTMSENLCAKCKKFYGNPQNLNMCSVCFKEQIKSQKIATQASNFKIPEVTQQPASKQADHTRCFICNKRIGILGNRCKGCECSYCNGHRLPEDHKCDGDFIEMAKVQIKKNNPNITAPKIEKI